MTMPSETKTEKYTDGLNQRFSKLNDEQSGLITQLQDKVHLILSRRNQETTEGKDIPKPNDFIEAQHYECTRLEQQNGRLYRIMEHLNEII